MPAELSEETLLTTADKTAYIITKIKPIFSDIVVAVIILLIGLILSKLLGRIIQKLLNSIELNKLLKGATGIGIKMEEFAGKATTYIIFFFSIIAALDILNLTPAILYIISVMIILIIVISVALSIKDFIPNLFAGLFLHKKNFIKEGDYIRVEDVEGQVVHVNLIETRIKTKAGDIIYIPNSTLTKNKVVKVKNWKRFGR